MSKLQRSNNPAISTLASLLMSARPQGHIYHLQATTYAEHIALDEFYKGIGKAADAIIEAYQGQYGVVHGYKFAPMLEDNMPIAYLKELRTKITQLRYEAVPKEITNIHNEIDNAVTLIDAVIYKLVNLK